MLKKDEIILSLTKSKNEIYAKMIDGENKLINLNRESKQFRINNNKLPQKIYSENSNQNKHINKIVNFEKDENSLTKDSNNNSNE